MRLRIGWLWLALPAALNAAEPEVGGPGHFVGLTPERPYLHVLHEGRSIKVKRVQDPDYEPSGWFARTARKCPPYCINPVRPDPRIEVVGEYELFDFMENELRDGSGMLIDARTPAWYRKGTIPGSVNYPYTRLSAGAAEAGPKQVLRELGARPRAGGGGLRRLLERWGWIDARMKTGEWDFSEARDLILWCNGPTGGQSPRAIRGLLAVGYPPEKIRYYRGGMALWQFLGLTTVIPKQ